MFNRYLLNFTLPNFPYFLTCWLAYSLTHSLTYSVTQSWTLTKLYCFVICYYLSFYLLNPEVETTEAPGKRGSHQAVIGPGHLSSYYSICKRDSCYICISLILIKTNPLLWVSILNYSLSFLRVYNFTFLDNRAHSRQLRNVLLWK